MRHWTPGERNASSMTTVPPVTTSRPSENVKRLGLASTTGAVKSASRSAKSKSAGPVRVMRTAGRARLSSVRLMSKPKSAGSATRPASRSNSTKASGPWPGRRAIRSRLTANRPVNRLSSTRSMLVWRPLSTVSLPTATRRTISGSAHSSAPTSSARTRHSATRILSRRLNRSSDLLATRQIGHHSRRHVPKSVRRPPGAGNPPRLDLDPSEKPIEMPRSSAGFAGDPLPGGRPRRGPSRPPPMS